MKVQATKRLKPSRLYCKKWLLRINVKVTHLCSKIARLELKKIGGIFIKQWIMWFNATIPA